MRDVAVRRLMNTREQPEEWLVVDVDPEPAALGQLDPAAREFDRCRFGCSVAADAVLPKPICLANSDRRAA